MVRPPGPPIEKSNLLCGGLNDVLSSTAGGTTDQSRTQLNGLLDNGQLINALNRAFSQARTRLSLSTPAQAGNGPVLDPSLGPVRLDLLGLDVRLDNCAGGPVRVNISATPGGGLLDDLLCGPAGGTGRALTRQITGVLQQITTTPSGGTAG
jgi:hypothetical protein